MALQPIFNRITAWRKRTIGFGLAAAFLATPVLSRADDAAKPADAPLLTAAETKDVDAVVKSLITAGFPDASKAVVYRGKVRVTATFDASKQSPPLPTELSGMQESVPNSTAAKYGFEFDGVHFKLPDGTWIFSIAYQFKPAGDDDVNVDNASAVDLNTLTADATADAPFDADKDAPKYLKSVAPKNLDRTRAAMNRYVPVTKFLKITPDMMAPALVLLHQAGWKDADDMAVTIADLRSRSYWQMKPWTTPDSVFDPTGKYEGSKNEEAAWQKAHKVTDPEEPATAVRRAMFRWCRAQLMRVNIEDAMLTRDVAAACCKAAVDPKDPQKNGSKIDALVAAAMLPVERPAGAPLVDKLKSWEAQPRMPKMVVNSGAGGASFSTGFSAPKAAYEPATADLDALVDLLGDDSPSRYFDFNGDRSVGDNAWRAVAELLKADPRELAKYPTDKPWTADERKAAAKAVQAWWKDHRGDYIDK